MQAIIEQTAVPDTANTIDYLLNKLEDADNTLKNSIENKIVNIGEKIIPDLLRNLPTATGTKRGVIVMALIRNGRTAIEYKKEFAKENYQSAWMAHYILNEIV